MIVHSNWSTGYTFYPWRGRIDGCVWFNPRCWWIARLDHYERAYVLHFGPLELWWWFA